MVLGDCGSGVVEVPFIDGGILVGNEKDNVLGGSNGSDTFVINRGGGKDTIVIGSKDHDEYGRWLEEGGDGVDRLLFGDDIGIADLRFSVSGSNLVIEILGTEDRVTLQSWRSSANKVNTIFVGGMAVNKSSIYSLIDKMQTLGEPSGVSGCWSDSQMAALETAWREVAVSGNASMDVNNDDIFLGNTDDDVYHFGRGDGHDIIDEEDHRQTPEERAAKRNVIRLGEGIGVDDIELSAVERYLTSYSDLVVTIKDTRETLTVWNCFSLQWSNADNKYSVQAIEFADGSVWEIGDILQRVGMKDGTSLMTDNKIIGDDADNILVGTDAYDSIFGNDGKDVIQGGKGNDYLNGGKGEDTYVFNRGDGQDTIYNSYTVENKVGNTTYISDHVGDDDTLQFGEGIRPEDLWFEKEVIIANGIFRQSYYKIGIVGTDDVVTVDVDYYSNMMKVINAGGKQLNFLHRDMTEFFSAMAAIGRPAGEDGQWTAEQRAALDSVLTTYWEYPYPEDKVAEGGELGEYLLGDRANDNLSGNGGNDYLYGGAGGDYLSGGDGDDHLVGGDGNDILYGDDGDDFLHGGKGNDSLTGGLGDDVYLFNRGDGVEYIDEVRGCDRLVLGGGIAITDLHFSLTYDGYALQIDMVGTDDCITIFGWGWSDEEGNEGNVESIQIGDRELSYSQVQSLMNDMRAIGSPRGTGGAWSASQKQAIANTIIPKYWKTTNYALVEKTKYGADGDDILVANDNGQAVFGLSGDDVLHGGSKNDYLSGGMGNDVFVFKRGGGNDIVDAHDPVAGKHDSILLDNLLKDDVEFDSNVNGDFIIRVKGTSETITVLNGMKDSAHGIQCVRFGDGTEIPFKELDIPNIYGTSGDDTLEARNGGTHLYGFDGEDMLIGGSGDDVLHGGGGNDYLSGGKGNDVFVFGRGDGNDTVSAFEESKSSRDVIRLAGLNAADVDFTCDQAGNFVVRILDTGETLTVLKGVSDYNYGIQAIEFADGGIMEWDDVVLRDIWGNDLGNTLIAGNGSHILNGLGGNDRLYGGTGDDVLIGGAGDDYVDGGAGNDVFVFGRGDGNDVVNAYDLTPGKRDIIRLAGLTRNDVFFTATQTGDFLIRIKDSGETLSVRGGVNGGARGIQAVEFDDGSRIDWADVLLYDIWGTDGSDSLTATPSGNYLHGLYGDDVLTGGTGADVLHGGAGDDLLIGGLGNDVFLFGKGDGNDRIDARDAVSGKHDVLKLTDLTRDDVTFSTNPDGDLIVTLKETGETTTVIGGMRNLADGVQAIEFADGTMLQPSSIVLHEVWGTDSYDYMTAIETGGILHGRGGDDLLYGGNGDDVIHGDEGDDSLQGYNGNDYLEGGAGNDYLNGGTGNDVYIFGRGDGNDIVNAYDTGATRRDIVKLLGLSADEVEFLVSTGASGYINFIIRIRDTGETLTIKDAIRKGYANAANYYAIQAIEFGDGTIWDWDEICRRPFLMADGMTTSFADVFGSTIVGNDVNNIIDGGIGNDVLHGGAGNDTLAGGAGDDVYVFNRGDGHDIVNESETRVGKRNVIRLGAGIDVADVELLNVYSNASGRMDLVIRIKDTGETITVKSGLTTNTVNEKNATSIQAIEFADGTVWEWDAILQQAMYMVEEATNGYTDLSGSTLVGNALNNVMTGYAGNDTLYGGAGNDSLRGGSGNDVLYGGVGNDTLSGDDGDDELYGGAGNDTLNGHTGDDIYVFGRGDGHDVINETELRADRRNVIRIGEGIGIADIELLNTNRNGYHMDLVIRIKDTGETITVKKGLSYHASYSNAGNGNSIQAIEFADGTIWEWKDIIGQAMHMADADVSAWSTMEGSVVVGNALANTINGADGNDMLYGGAGNDTLNGGAGNDVLNGGSGNDILTGGAGDDVYVFNRGDGHDVVNETETRSGRRNVVRLGDGIGVGDVELLNVYSNVGNRTDLVIRIKDTGETITVKSGLAANVVNENNAPSIQAIEFADGTVWDWEAILRQTMYMSENATHGYADMAGSILVGNAQNNVMTGYAGDDVLHGGAGNDTLNGGAGNDVLHGEEGADILNGGNGDDVYVFGRGDGHDVINETETRTDRRNVVRLGAGIGAGDIELLSTGYSGGYMDLVIRIKDTGETITVKKGLSYSYLSPANSYSIQAIEFADGAVWEWEDIRSQAFAVGDVDLTGYANADGSFLIGNALNNTLTGGGKNDILHGGAGADKLDGGAGDDVLWGESGNDTLKGGTGNDIYVFGRGDGNDTIDAYDSTAGKDDRIRLVGLNVEDVEFSRSGNNFVIRIKDTGETVTVTNGMQNTAYGIQSIEFADGSVIPWSSDLVNGGVVTNDGVRNSDGSISGGAGNDTIYGGTGDDTLYGEAGNDILYGWDGEDRLHGGAGDDVLHGGAGNDLLDGGAGNDRLEGGAGDDAYLFGRGSGHDVVSESETRLERRNVIRLGVGIGVDDVEFLSKTVNSSESDFILRIRDTGETITVAKGIYSNKANSATAAAIQAIEFADGTVWDWDDILRRGLLIADGSYSNYGYLSAEGGAMTGNAAANKIWGSAVNDVIHGGAGNDILLGNAGNDVLWGGSGNDQLEGGVGNDVYLFGRGDGHDVVNAYDTTAGKVDGIRLLGLSRDDVEFAMDGNNFIIRIKDTGETVTVTNCLTSYAYAIQFIEFADGSTLPWSPQLVNPAQIGDMNDIRWDYGSEPLDAGKNRLLGTDGNDTIFGEAGDDAIYGKDGNDSLCGLDGADILYGGAGSDRLEGGNGDDVYLFGRGDGHDTVYETETRANRRNVIRLGAGIGVNDIEFLVKPVAGYDSDFIIRIKDTGESITVAKGIYWNRSNAATSGSIQAIEFTDGTVWNWNDILEQPLQLADGSYGNQGHMSGEGGTLIGNNAANTLYGSDNADVLYGGAGNDNLYGYAGDDVLYGDAGNDNLYGYAGDDVLCGALGNDRLEGAAGDDTYLFGRGDGVDTIYDTAGNDKLVFGDDIGMSDIWFSKSGNNLIIDLIGSTDRITMSYWYSNDVYKVETIVAGGMELASTQMDQMIQALASFGAPGGIDGQWTDEQKEQLAPVLSSYWRPAGS